MLNEIDINICFSVIIGILIYIKCILFKNDLLYVVLCFFLFVDICYINVKSY